jgi:hypothetical protein|tara:strand:+ start:69 stop:329 length:261 start_codon:yes stop_codon:yes gene_type:complete
MREYIYKVIIFAIAIVLVFKFTIGKEITNITSKVDLFSSTEGRKKIVTSLKKEIKKANEKENYLDEEERILIRNFIIKIKKELATD